MPTFVVEHPYLFTNITSLILILTVCAIIVRDWRGVILAGLFHAPAFPFMITHELDYWQPARVGDWPVGIEDALCAFDVGAMAWIPVVIFFFSSLQRQAFDSSALRRYFYGSAILGFSYMLLLHWGLSSLTALLVTSMTAGIVILLLRPHLIRIVPVALVGFVGLYFLIVRIYFHIWPNFIRDWYPDTIWSQPIWGLPMGEIIWSAVYAFFWPLFTAFILGTVTRGNTSEVR